MGVLTSMRVELLTLVLCLPVLASGASIWDGSAVPAIPWYNDEPATLGVKFRSDVSGSVTGIRFYKGSGNTGTHIGLLYSSTGTWSRTTTRRRTSAGSNIARTGRKIRRKRCPRCAA